MITILIAILFFSIIIMVHEMGHFITARLTGIYAEEFSIGMGPRLLKYEGKETVYSIRALPIGGYVKFLGEDDNSEDPRAFNNAKVWKRMIVLFAGSGMNIILALVLMVVSFMGFGVYVTSPVLESIVDNGPAYSAGLREGDRIISIDGLYLEGDNSDISIFDLSTIINNRGNVPITFEFQRNGAILSADIIPKFDKDSGEYRIGVLFGNDVQKLGLMESIKVGFIQTGRIVVIMLDMLRNLIFHGVGVGEVMGPVGIVGEIGRAAQAGIQQLINLAIIITLNLGIINLIPFPALDGGRLVLLSFEALRGKPLDHKKEGYLHLIGFAALMILMFLVTFQDIFRR